MPRVCTVCAHEKRAEIDRLLSDGSRIVSQHSIQYTVALTRYRKNASGDALPISTIEGASTGLLRPEFLTVH